MGRMSTESNFRFRRYRTPDTRTDGGVAPIAAVPCRGLVTLAFQAEGSAIRHRRRNPKLGHAS